ncbi:MAG: nucleotide exchange factor GrpE [Novosphingobium sp.]|uniref:nucleotide exchange factor GrpE n=1 Tax=Novosphingobium sp. TaxID=1874826 RepID=UPI0032BDD4EC
MSDEKKPQGDPAVDAELAGVPEDLIDLEQADHALSDALAHLKNDLEAARQEILYAKAETQNVRRRLEKDVADAKAYAATGFARDMLSVADNLSRALDAIPQELREDERLNALVAGIEATSRELDKVFGLNGITRIAATGMPLDPNQHQAMLEVPSNDAAPGTIVQELQAGYMIKDRLLRPAMVAVAKKPD